MICVTFMDKQLIYLFFIITPFSRKNADSILRSSGQGFHILKRKTYSELKLIMWAAVKAYLTRLNAFRRPE